MFHHRWLLFCLILFLFRTKLWNQRPAFQFDTWPSKSPRWDFVFRKIWKKKFPQKIHNICILSVKNHQMTQNDENKREKASDASKSGRAWHHTTPHVAHRSLLFLSKPQKNLLLCSVCLSVVNKKRQNCPHQLLKLSIWLAPLGSIIFKFFKSTEMSPKLNRWIIG